MLNFRYTDCELPIPTVMLILKHNPNSEPKFHHILNKIRENMRKKHDNSLKLI